MKNEQNTRSIDRLSVNQRAKVLEIAAKMYDQNLYAENENIWQIIDSIIRVNKTLKKSRRPDTISVAIFGALKDEPSRRLHRTFVPNWIEEILK